MLRVPAACILAHHCTLKLEPCQLASPPHCPARSPFIQLKFFLKREPLNYNELFTPEIGICGFEP